LVWACCRVTVDRSRTNGFCAPSMKPRRHWNLSSTDHRSLESYDEFHIDHIQPAAELESGLFEVPDLFEAELGVEPDTGLVIGVDGRDDGVQAPRSGGFNQGGQQQFAQ